MNMNHRRFKGELRGGAYGASPVNAYAPAPPRPRLGAVEKKQTNKKTPRHLAAAQKQEQQEQQQHKNGGGETKGGVWVGPLRRRGI